MEVSEAHPLKALKSAPRTYSYKVQDPFDLKNLMKKRLRIKNLEMCDQGPYFRKRHFLPAFKRRQNYLLKGLISLRLDTFYPNPSRYIECLKPMFSKLKSFSVQTRTFEGEEKRLTQLIGQMKYLTHFEDLDRLIPSYHPQRIKTYYSLKRMESLKLPFHLSVKELPRLKFLTIDLGLIGSLKSISKVPLQLIELSLIDKRKELYSYDRVKESFYHIRHQLNYLICLRKLNLVFHWMIFYQEIFPILNLKNLEINIYGQIDFEEKVMRQIKEFINRTNSKVIIFPTATPEAEKYERFLDCLFEKFSLNDLKHFQVEKLFYDISFEKALQKKIVDYYLRREHHENLKKLTFIFEINSDINWSDQEMYHKMIDNVKAKNSQLMLTYQMEYSGALKKINILDCKRICELLHRAAVSNWENNEIMFIPKRAEEGKLVLLDLSKEILLKSSFKIGKVVWDCCGNEFVKQSIEKIGTSILEDAILGGNIKEYQIINGKSFV